MKTQLNKVDNLQTLPQITCSAPATATPQVFGHYVEKHGPKGPQTCLLDPHPATLLSALLQPWRLALSATTV